MVVLCTTIHEYPAMPQESVRVCVG